MNETPIQGIMETTLEKIKAMVSADTIIGERILLPDNIVAIPISKVSYGFASGGSDFPSKTPSQKLFGGGGGAGISISPIGFLIVKDGDVKLLPVSQDSNAAEKAVTLIPDLFDKMTALFKKKKDDNIKPDINV